MYIKFNAEKIDLFNTLMICYRHIEDVHEV